ncbi:MAG: hypothetical protein COU69_02205 [Candidatus Pacebacteria bacterium CG10_big_fil_rev_8_21_14_0_10_56_10]|nr:MAG: hypothetical protein COU69_02205 [Candidatus Pacebacteria bacterium CG10_big_fil_rev_8_21_14_0_10_56_10]
MISLPTLPKLVRPFSAQYVSREFIHLTSFHGFFQFYTSVVAFFGIPFFYQAFGSVFLAFLPFALGRFGLGLLSWPVGRLVGQIGTRMGVLLSVLITVLGSVPILLFERTDNIIWALLWLASLFGTRLFLFVPFDYYQAQLTHVGRRGSEMALKRYLLLFVMLMAPFVGGLTVDTFGFFGLVLVATTGMVVSLLSVVRLPNYKFDVKLSRADLTAHRSAIIAASSFLQQAHSMFTVPLWVLFVFLFLGQSALRLGVFFFVSIAVSLLVNYLIGLYLDSHQRGKMLIRTFLGEAVVNVLRGLQVLPIFVTELLGRTVGNFRNQAYEVFYSDEITVGIRSSKRGNETIVLEIISQSLAGLVILLGAGTAEAIGIRPTFVVIGVMVMVLLAIEHNLIEEDLG